MGEKKDEDKKATAGHAVVMKLDLHCQGCAGKVKRSISRIHGVEKVETDCESNKVTVYGKVDAAALRERVESRTKKKAELLSPLLKRDPENEHIKGGDDKKSKQAGTTTVVIKIKLHCEGCSQKIKRLIEKNVHGVNSVRMDLHKDMVTVMGSMNAKELLSLLKEELKRDVEIVKKDGGGGGGGGSGKNNKLAGETNSHDYNYMPMFNKSYFSQDYGFPVYLNNPTHPMTGPFPPPPPSYVNILNDRFFSDENPNGCLVM